MRSRVTTSHSLDPQDMFYQRNMLARIIEHSIKLVSHKLRTAHAFTFARIEFQALQNLNFFDIILNLRASTKHTHRRIAEHWTCTVLDPIHEKEKKELKTNKIRMSISHRMPNRSCHAVDCIIISLYTLHF